MESDKTCHGETVLIVVEHKQKNSWKIIFFCNQMKKNEHPKKTQLCREACGRRGGKRATSAKPLLIASDAEDNEALDSTDTCIKNGVHDPQANNWRTANTQVTPASMQWRKPQRRESKGQ